MHTTFDMAVPLGQTAYQALTGCSGSPEWSSIPSEQQLAWEAAALAVIARHEHSKQRAVHSCGFDKLGRLFVTEAFLFESYGPHFNYFAEALHLLDAVILDVQDHVNIEGKLVAKEYVINCPSFEMVEGKRIPQYNLKFGVLDGDPAVPWFERVDEARENTSLFGGRNAA